MTRTTLRSVSTFLAASVFSLAGLTAMAAPVSSAPSRTKASHAAKVMAKADPAVKAEAAAPSAEGVAPKAPAHEHKGGKNKVATQDVTKEAPAATGGEVTKEGGKAAQPAGKHGKHKMQSAASPEGVGAGTTAEPAAPATAKPAVKGGETNAEKAAEPASPVAK